MSEPAPGRPDGAPPTEHERTVAMLAHLAALAGLLVPLFGNVLGPVAVLATRRTGSPFVTAHVKEAVNFNITVSLAAVLCAFLALVFIGLLLGAALFIAWLVLTLVAAIRASEGAPYRYPFAIRLVR